MAEPEAGADANQGYGHPVYTPYGHSGHGYGQVSAYGHPLYKREAEAEAEAEPEADPALLYGAYYGYGLGYYGGLPHLILPLRFPPPTLFSLNILPASNILET